MILVVCGTRPEFIKLKPVMDEFDSCGIEYEFLWVKQHTTLMPEEAKVRADKVLELGIYDDEMSPERFNNRLDFVSSNILRYLDYVVDLSKYSAVMVQGDTATVFTAALAAFHRQIPVIHIEAGLRSFDLKNPYPEEFYRRAVSCMASLNFCPTARDYQNLFNEKLPGEYHLVGNTVLDNIRDVETSYGDDVIVTLHRRENHRLLEEWLTELDKAAAEHPELTFKFLAHPNPNVQKHLGALQNVVIMDPMPHEDFIKLVANSRFIITDSGGLVEESCFLQKRSIVCRKRTERSSAVTSGHSELCFSPSQLTKLVREFKEKYEISTYCPFGDGYASQKIARIVKNFLR